VEIEMTDGITDAVKMRVINMTAAAEPEVELRL